MTRAFHGAPFDEATLLKLDIFRGYIRSWLPVFLSKRSYPNVNIFDFFAGPGRDINGQSGYPLVIIDEVSRYFLDESFQKAPQASVTLYFNDSESENIQQLKNNVEDILKDRDPGYNIRFENDDFETAFFKELPFLKRSDTANLVILDQFGLKQINDRIFDKLISCSATDILFFISSSYIKRFITEGSIRKYFPFSEDEIKEISPKDIHRYICREFYRKRIPKSLDYFLSPFSIQKDHSANIYGLIFGSGKLLGLQKFLEVCWNKDQVTGEANYNIDNDSIRTGQLSLFPEDNVIKKQDRFEKDMVRYIKEKKPTNKDLYRFCLENGFLPRHVTEILRELQQSSHLEVKDPVSNDDVRKGAFYISWENYKKPYPRARFSWMEADK
ncbi:conserved hypothetical protein [Candidatus Desulfarcum epimagneticum]|uniref:GMT-like wHTH domain-containing protein n=1 Tax=uncultured Desulfobacteraceae bacterium TaxID=218296 RepID=A0A484HMG8_9BACT|nr:conserved hypothetical protein [uncultured Desulfobacteraceae bacterium]